MTVQLDRTTVERGEAIRGKATVQNVGSVSWLPGSTARGGVNLGVHLRARDGRPISLDFARIRLEGATHPANAARRLRARAAESGRIPAGVRSGE
jgi:hypothetical protein